MRDGRTERALRKAAEAEIDRKWQRGVKAAAKTKIDKKKHRVLAKRESECRGTLAFEELPWSTTT